MRYQNGEKELDKFKERWDDLKLFVENVINKEGSRIICKKSAQFLIELRMLLL